VVEAVGHKLATHLFATIILLLPMIYFLLAAPAFLLVRLDIPPVAQLLRGMFNGYFLTLAIASAIGTIAVAVAGRLVLAIGIGLIAAFAASSRRWFLRQMDARLSDRDAGDADAVRRPSPTPNQPSRSSWALATELLRYGTESVQPSRIAAKEKGASGNSVSRP
jgi:hypothetical protein